MGADTCCNRVHQMGVCASGCCVFGIDEPRPLFLVLVFG